MAGSVPGALDTCERELIATLEEFARFDEATPCSPPRPAELEQLERRAIRPDSDDQATASA